MSRLFKYVTPLGWFACVASVAAILYGLVNLLFNWLLPSDALAASALQRAFGELLGMLCCFGSLFFPRHVPLPSPAARLTTRGIQRRGPLLLGLVFLTAVLSLRISPPARCDSLLAHAPAFPPHVDAHRPGQPVDRDSCSHLELVFST